MVVVSVADHGPVAVEGHADDVGRAANVVRIVTGVPVRDHLASTAESERALADAIVHAGNSIGYGLERLAGAIVVSVYIFAVLSYLDCRRR